ncbi:MAG TPA: sulfite exporter TauE/SafE family protein [Burkholderiaceae bacterium]|nr:sulfite exporter TauE/SafE family protein [Burkholderiaceae bacterium]
MDAALLAAAALMGLAGAPHCTAMCSAACGLTVRRCAPAQPLAGSAAFLGGRLFGYAAAGALAAWVVSSLGELAATAAPLRALWTLFHLAALGLGLWLLLMARQPAWLERLGSAPVRAPGTLVFVNGPARAGAVGLGWFALPCGLLQSALVIAALANGPLGGAGVMAAFAVTSSSGLAVLPLVLRRGLRGDAARSPRWAIRLAGLGLAATSGWALGHGMWQRIAALCGV